jgi:hypothetical protein
VRRGRFRESLGQKNNDADLCRNGLPCPAQQTSDGIHDDVRDALMEQRLERFIGVIYRPDTERWSHYSSASLPAQFDAYVWFDTTSAVTVPPESEQTGQEEHATEQTFPFGV